MTCSTSYCLVTLKDLWNACMYVCTDCSTRTAVTALSVTFTLSADYTNDHVGPVCIDQTRGCEMQQQAESGKNPTPPFVRTWCGTVRQQIMRSTVSTTCL
jgi:hypothetical protein